MAFADFALDPERLREYGVKVSLERKTLLDRALVLENKAVSDAQLDLHMLVRLTKKAHKQYYGITAKQERLKLEDFTDETPLDHRRRSRRRARLTPSE